MNSSKECLQYIRQRLYYPFTGLLYDSRIEAETKLPSKEEIDNDIPTPNGNGTVMEDCMISGGTCLHGLCSYMARTNGDACDFAAEIADGMLKSAESGKNGFIPRGVHPLDGKMHYRDCSRDQITMFLYGLLRYYFSGFCPESLKCRIASAAAAIAERAERNVRKENGWNMLTEDGKPSVNGVLWGDSCHMHEFFRLPQIFLTSYLLTKDEKYRELYLSVRDEGLFKSIPDNNSYGGMYCLQQMAASVDTARRFDEDAQTQAFSADILNRIADCARQRIADIRQSIESASEADFSKRDYYVHFYNIQGAAVIPMLEALAPDREISEESILLCKDTLTKIPYSGKTALPVHFFCALELCREKCAE